MYGRLARKKCYRSELATGEDEEFPFCAVVITIAGAKFAQENRIGLPISAQDPEEDFALSLYSYVPQKQRLSWVFQMDRASVQKSDQRNWRAHLEQDRQFVAREFAE